MSQEVHDKFDELILALDDEGWNMDIIDDIKILKHKYEKEENIRG